MKVTLKQVYDASMAIKNVETEKGSNKWAYAITRNKKILEPDMRGVAEAVKPFNEINKKRLNYCKEHCIKDATGDPVMMNGAYKGVSESDPELVLMVAEMKKLDAEFTEFLKTETEVDLHMISFSDIPSNISPKDFEGLSIMIEEPVKKPELTLTK